MSTNSPTLVVNVYGRAALSKGRLVLQHDRRDPVTEVELLVSVMWIFQSCR